MHSVQVRIPYIFLWFQLLIDVPQASQNGEPDGCRVANLATHPCVTYRNAMVTSPSATNASASTDSRNASSARCRCHRPPESSSSISLGYNPGFRIWNKMTRLLFVFTIPMLLSSNPKRLRLAPRSSGGRCPNLRRKLQGTCKYPYTVCDVVY